MKDSDNKDLLYKIQSKRKEMYKTANQYGVTDSRTIVTSQELDDLLNEYQYFHQGLNISVRYKAHDV
ncbi:aspartyl-phosphate phosphatase Spo0E family protein [Bacillus sp. FJAT-44742]|uniref:aspartyl-phosphate phosphatase Spo0E family protein n=1 Tax=Bacillus sp. FJAT-44742 TaxID=2014005 RepID=UPI000C2338BA|nr:aspartyl-phosphate phosphatase Spo0E family protein [Bacillus sp. FJAT-44742]